VTTVPDVAPETLGFLVDSAPDGVAIVVRGIVTFINPRGAQLFAAASPAAVVGTSITDYLPAEDARLATERIAEMFRTGEEQPPNEYRVLADPSRTLEIKSVRCSWQGQPAVLAFARDVTERKVIERRLIETDRLTALGTLAAGVAHEINNPLTYAQLSLQRIERATGVPDHIREYLRDIEHGIARVASITQSLRTFARADDAPPGPVELHRVIDRALKMVDNDLRHRAELTRRFADAPAVTGNTSRLEQVFVNLLLNAIHALTGDVRQIEVAIEPAGDQVVATVRDTGHGIAAAVQARVFDPFFTTRPVGEGMGLGLSVCKSIVASFGGTIDLTSTEGDGTTVRVSLPVHRTRPAALPPATVTTATPRRRVLIVDDERLVRDTIARVLASHHDVTAVDSGLAAIAAIARAAYDVIICDVMMPGFDGREVHRRLAAEHPGLERRIVFITGGTFAPDIDAFLASCGNRCLAKPFGIEQILDAVATAT
jgi:PAS domain S-box-containing protein